MFITYFGKPCEKLFRLTKKKTSKIRTNNNKLGVCKLNLLRRYVDTTGRSFKK